MVNPAKSDGTEAAQGLTGPRSPIRIDWASLQSESRTSSDESKPFDRDAYTTPPPKDAGLPRSSIDDGTMFAKLAAKRTSSSDRVYDIPTLMRYQGSLAGIAVFAKIKPEALRENLFQFISATRPAKSFARVRTLSEISNRSRRSAMPAQPDNASKMNGFLPHPTYMPPANHAPQQSEGFARFLKQHASPPHHRVTAGGRIVPTGPHSPPPMFDYESLTGLMGNRRPKGPASQFQPHVPLLRDTPFGVGHSFMQPSASASIGSSRVFDGYVPMNAVLPYMQIKPHASQGGVQPMQNGLASPPAALVPMGAFEDGSIMTLCNGLYYRTYWNGMSTIIEPLSITSAPQHATFQANQQPQSTQYQPPSALAQSSRGHNLEGSLANSTNWSRVSSSGSQGPRRAHNLEAQQQSLKTSLQSLDRHLALHHYELSNEQRSSYISQRRSLVEEIDKLRRVKEPSNENLPPVNVKDLAKRAKDRIRQSSSGQRKPMVDIQVDNVTANTLSSRDLPKKGLSPDAAPFVPGSLKPAGPQLASTSDRISKSGSHNSSLAVGPDHNQELSLGKDPLDPAMRVIHKSDVTYASQLEGIKMDGKKMYCTKVSEFQEAIRQVRQQARLYGCAGGSSKDPAYDAEQDIWWAICDRDPIPVPAATPDYVKNPRPWDWNDSAFNNRRSKDSRQPASSLSCSIEAPSGNETRKLQIVQQGKLFREPDASAAQTKKNQNSPARSLQALVESNIPQRAHVEEVPSQKQRTPPDTTPVDGEAMVNVSSKRPKNLSESDARFLKEGIWDGRPTTRIPLKPQSNVAPAQGPKSKAPSQSVSDAPSFALATTPKKSGPLIPTRDASTKRNTDSSNEVTQSFTIEISNRQTTKGPRKAKSKHSLKGSTPLRRHRQMLKHFHSEKRPALGAAHLTNSMNVDSETVSKNPPDDSSDTSRQSLLAKTTQQLSPRAAARRALQFYDRSRSKSPLKMKHSSSQLRQSQARVNLPSFANTHMKNKLKSNATISSEVRAVNVPSPSKDSFLRDMLRGSRYTHHRNSGSVSPTKRKMLSRPQSLGGEEDDMEANKENAPSERLSGATIIEGGSDSTSLQVDNHARVLPSKAQSSLASSSFQAMGFLPQFDGAGRAQTSNVHQQHGISSLPRAAKVNLPRASTSSDHTSTPDPGPQITPSKPD